MSLRGFFLIVYAFITVALFASFNASLLVYISFLLNAVLLSFIVVYHLFYERDSSPFISAYIVFTFLFFLVAPVIQINSFKGLIDASFVNNFPYNENMVFYSNMLILTFNFIFIISYILFKKRKRKKENYYYSVKYLSITIFSILILSGCLFLLSYNFVLRDLATPSWMEYKESVGKLLVWKKVLFMVPFGGVILCFQYLKSNNRLKNNYYIIFGCLVLFMLLLFWFKNPFTEKRNALGPIYLCLVFLFYPKLFSTNVKSLSILFFIMVVLFPLSSILTHTDATFSQIINNPSILILEAKYGGLSKTFNTLHYDAFSNLNATVSYVSINGASYGFQLLSALLFFVPRSIWHGKPISTGQLIGEDLIENYSFSFSNLSNPLVSEAYINFGVFGIFIFSILFAYIIVKFLSWYKSDSLMKRVMAFYLAIHLIFLLRGDFTNGFSYYVGTLFGVILITRLVDLFIRELFKLSKK